MLSAALLALSALRRRFASGLSIALFVAAAAVFFLVATVQAQHTAFVFNTDGTALPVVLTDAIRARCGADAIIVEIAPNSPTKFINGAAVLDRGTVTLPRFDFNFVGAAPPSPVAQHFLVSGDLTLTSNQSIWGWGDRLLKIEVVGSVQISAGAFVTVSALGRLGGAGGGDGGVPVSADLRFLAFTSGSAPGGRGGAAGSPLGNVGEAGGDGYANVVGTLIRGATQTEVGPERYASSTSGGAGTRGQGDSFNLSGGAPAVSAGGAAQTYAGGIPAWGAGGTGGAQGALTTFDLAGNGQPGQGGTGGQNGFAAVSGAAAPLTPTLAGVALHLRGGSGGGAGASGGLGLPGGMGGGGGGGGASAAFLRGGLGGTGELGGLGGAGGLGGTGGGGGGGLQFLVRGFFKCDGLIEAKGASGLAGVAGVAGTIGTVQNGSPGNSNFFSHGGQGGPSGKGGDGGRGGNGGNGAAGSGGSIQIAAAQFDPGGEYQAAGVPAGLVQIHSFTGTEQNTPFGAFAAGLNPYRSYTVPNLGAPIQQVDPATTPMLPFLRGGPAPYGVQGARHVSALAARNFQATPETAALVTRVNPTEIRVDMAYPNYDALVYSSAHNGAEVPLPAWRAINPDDLAASQPGVILPYHGVVPPGLLPLLQRAGYEDDPLLVPGASGPQTGPVEWDLPYFMLVEKGKPFTVEASFAPYDVPRVFRATPTVGTNPVRLKDFGLLLKTMQREDGPEPRANIGSQQEGDEDLVQETYVRIGSTVQIRCHGMNRGRPNSLSSGSGTFGLYYPNGVSSVAARSFANIASEQEAYDYLLIIPTAGWTPGTQSLLAQTYLNPVYDDNPRTQILKMDGRFVSPLAGLGGLDADQTLSFLIQSGTTSTRTFQLTNARAVPISWRTSVNANPGLARLTVLRAEIVGAGAHAFQVPAGPLTVERLASQNVAVTFAPTAPGNYSAVLRLITDEGADNGQPGRILEIPLFGAFQTYAAWAANLPPAVSGPAADANDNGVPNLFEYAWGALPFPGSPTLTVSKLPSGIVSNLLEFPLPLSARADVRWEMEGSRDLLAWRTLGFRGANEIWSALPAGDSVTEALLVQVRRVQFTHLEDYDRYFFRLKATLAASDYANDFNTESRAETRGTAVHLNGSLRLTDAVGGQTGAAVLSGVEVWPGQNGFEASFLLALGPTGAGGGAADGVSFSVGDLGTAAWGENGPSTARHLTVAFDSYDNQVGPAAATGIRLMRGATMIAYSPTNPFTNGANVPVQVSFTPATGATVRFNGSPVFTNVPIVGFTLQPGDRYGFGARTGGFSEVHRVDDVLIAPR